MVSRLLRAVGALAAAIAVAAIGVGIGASLTVRDVFPVPSIGRKIILAIYGPPKETGRRIESTLVQLEIERMTELPKATRPQGGGIATFGDEFVVINNDGRLFAIRDGQAVEAPFKAPDNGYAQYLETAKRLVPQGYTFNLDRLRYNDVLVVGTEGDRRLLVSYIEWSDKDQCYRNTVSGVSIPAGVTRLTDLPPASAWTPVYSTRPCLPLKKISRALEGHMSGGKLADLGDGRFVLSSGDYHWDGTTGPFSPKGESAPAVAQDPDFEYGKVLAVDWRTGTSTVLSSGNRNMQGIAVTPDGRVWTVEHGPRGGDELNLHLKGRNHGWPLKTYGTQYNLLPYPGAVPYGRHDGFDPPAYAWLPSVGISGLTTISGFDEAWNGDLLAASLRAGSLFRIRIEGDRAVYAEPIPIGTRIRAVHQGPGGRIGLWTDDDRVFVLVTRKGSLAIEAVRAAVAAANLGESLKTRVDAAVMACAECHSFEPESNEASPTLGRLWNRRVASTPYPRYSPALAKVGGSWDAARLEAFLANPQAVAPGTAMPDPKLDADVRRALLGVFEAVSREGN